MRCIRQVERNVGLLDSALAQDDGYRLQVWEVFFVFFDPLLIIIEADKNRSLIL